MERLYEQPVSDQQLESMRQATEPCFEINDVTRVQTLTSPDRKRFICIFKARDSESVRRAMESAGVKYDTVWPATVF